MNTKVITAITLWPIAAVVALFLWLLAGLPTPEFMGGFSEVPLRTFILLIVLGLPYYLALLLLHAHYDVLGNGNDKPLPYYLRSRRPDEVESILKHLVTKQAAINFACAFLLTAIPILFASIIYFEGVNPGTTFANQTDEQTGGWGILDIARWSALVGIAFAIWAANRDRKRPVFMPEALEREPGISRTSSAS